MQGICVATIITPKQVNLFPSLERCESNRTRV